MRYNFFNHLINLFRFLALSPSQAKNNIRNHFFLNLQVSLNPNQTSFFSMLKPISMTFGYFIIASFLNPNNLIHILVPPVIHQLQGDSVLGIDSPKEQKSFFLQLGHRQGFDQLVRKGFIRNCDSSSRSRARKLPGRVHHNDIKKLLLDLQLTVNQTLEVVRPHICTYRDAVLGRVLDDDSVRFFLEKLELFFVYISLDLVDFVLDLQQLATETEFGLAGLLP